MKDKSYSPLSIGVVDGALTISIWAGTLAWASRPENGGNVTGCRVDARRKKAWARDVAYEIGREDEQGNSPLTALLDAAMQAAVENGSEALNFPRRKRPC